MVQIHSDHQSFPTLGELGHPSDNPLPHFTSLPFDDPVDTFPFDDPLPYFTSLPLNESNPSFTLGVSDNFELMVIVNVMNGNVEGLENRISDPRFSPDRILTVNSKQMTYIDLVVEQRLNLLPRLATPESLLEVSEVFLKHGVKPTQTSLRMAVQYGDNDLFDLLVKYNAILHGYVLVDAYMLWLSSGKQDFKDIFDKISSKGIAFPEELKFLIHIPINFFHQ